MIESVAISSSRANKKRDKWVRFKLLPSSSLHPSTILLHLLLITGLPGLHWNVFHTQSPYGDLWLGELLLLTYMRSIPNLKRPRSSIMSRIKANMKLLVVADARWYKEKIFLTKDTPAIAAGWWICVLSAKRSVRVPPPGYSTTLPRSWNLATSAWCQPSSANFRRSPLLFTCDESPSVYILTEIGGAHETQTESR